MLDAHFHRAGDATFLVCDDGEYRFYGLHPWQAQTQALDEDALRAALEADAAAGVGEIGLDRLKSREIPPEQRLAFAAQLETAAAFGRPVVLHGAKCWGEVAKACRAHAASVPAFLFHGFSRSWGLLPDLVALNGFVSVGPALLNDHAVNYARAVAALPASLVLLETDAQWTDETAHSAQIEAILLRLSELRACPPEALREQIASNLRRFTSALRS